MTLEELDEWERRLALYKIPATLDWFLPRLIAAYRAALAKVERLEAEVAEYREEGEARTVRR